MGKITDAIKNSASFQELEKYNDLVEKDNPLPWFGKKDSDEASRLLAKNAVDEKLTPGEKLYVATDKLVDYGTGSAIGALISGAGSKALNKLMKSPAFKNALRKIPMPVKWQDRLTASAAKDSVEQMKNLRKIDRKMWKEQNVKKYGKQFNKALSKGEKAQDRLVDIAKDVYPPEYESTAEYMRKALSLGIENPEQYIKPKKDFPLTKRVLEKGNIQKPAANIRTESNPLEGILEREKPSNFDTLVKNSKPKEGVAVGDPFEKFIPFYKVMQEESEAALKKANRKAEVNAKKTAENVEKKLKADKLVFDEKISPFSDNGAKDMFSDVGTSLPYSQRINKTSAPIPNVDIPEIDAKKAAKIGAAAGGGSTFLKDIFDTLTYKPERNAIKYGFQTVDTPAGKVNKAISYYDYNQNKINPKDLTNELINKIEAIDKSTLDENQLKAYEAIDELLLSAGTYQNVAKWIYSPEGQKTIKALSQTNK